MRRFWKYFLILVRFRLNLAQNDFPYPLGASVVRINETQLQLDFPFFQALITPEMWQIKNIFESAGHEIRIIGGAIRDLLRGIHPKDVEFATTAHPQESMRILQLQSNIMVFKKKSEKCATISFRVNRKSSFEVSTLRKDYFSPYTKEIKNKFTENWKSDAFRRDLTINALSLDFRGIIHDYFNGFDDLMNRKIRFIGDPDIHIKKDYSRILRYFRFYGQLASESNQHENVTLKAISDNAKGLDNVPGEKIWFELKAIIQGNFVEQIFKKMLDAGLGPHIGLHPKEQLDIPSFEFCCRSVRSGERYEMNPITFIGAIFTTEEQVHEFKIRMKISNNCRNHAMFIMFHKYDNFSTPAHNPLEPYQDYLIQTRQYKLYVREYILDLFRMRRRWDLLNHFLKWRMPNFPVSGDDLADVGIRSGLVVGYILDRLRALWCVTNFSMKKKTLLKKAPEYEKEYLALIKQYQ